MTFILVLLLAAAGAAATSPGASPDSGPAIGAMAPAFDPQHVAGPDKGTHACPMCKYGSGRGILAWVNTESLDAVSALAGRLEKEMRDKGAARLRAFVIYMNPGRRPAPDVERLLADVASKADLKQVALTYVPSPTDEETAGLYDINPDPRVRNTILVYDKRRIVGKFVNLPADPPSLDRLVAAVDHAVGGR